MTTTGFNSFEAMISEGAETMVGDPFWVGLLILGVLGVIALVQGGRADSKMLIIVPAAILATTFHPLMWFVVLLIVSGLLFMTIMKFMAK